MLYGSVMSELFTDREHGPRPRTVDRIDKRVWGGLRALVSMRLQNDSFGWRFPQQCEDGNVGCGCNLPVFLALLDSLVPSMGLPLPMYTSDPPGDIFDMLEFCADSVGEPIEGGYHSSMNHTHLSWDREAGLARFVTDVNAVFARNGVAYEMSPEGRIRRLLPEPLATELSQAIFATGDDETDRLLETGRRRILSPKMDDRQDALEKLWDAFERMKTLEPGTKKNAQAEALLDRVAPAGGGLRQVLDAEAKALTDIGNEFRIRHSETTQELLSDPVQIDYFFARMFAFIRWVLHATGRGG